MDVDDVEFLLVLVVVDVGLDFVGACFDISEGILETDIVDSRGGLFDFMFDEFTVLKIKVYVN